jgi:hypothetical protein
MFSSENALKVGLLVQKKPHQFLGHIFSDKKLDMHTFGHVFSDL